MAEAPVARMILKTHSKLRLVLCDEEVDLRVGSHEIGFLLLTLGPVLERTLGEVNSSDGLGDDVCTESCTIGSASTNPSSRDAISCVPLCSEFVHHFGTGHTIWETWEVLDLDSSASESDTKKVYS